MEKTRFEKMLKKKKTVLVVNSEVTPSKSKAHWGKRRVCNEAIKRPSLTDDTLI